MELPSLYHTSLELPKGLTSQASHACSISFLSTAEGGVAVGAEVGVADGAKVGVAVSAFVSPICDGMTVGAEVGVADGAL